MKYLFLILLLTFSSVSSATKYYVSNSGGNDTNDGKSEVAAWKTISKVNGKTFLAGDSILFKKGDVWREKLSINSSGSGGKYITFGSYGTGSKPQILGSTKAITWTAEGHSNIWVSATTVSDPSSLGMSGSDIFFNSSGTIKQGFKKTYSSTFANLSAEYNWTWSANRIYVYAPSDPNTRYTAVEVPQLDWGISINEKEYIMIDGFEIHFGCSGGITTASYPTANKSYLTIKNCEISYSGLLTPNTIPDVDNYGIHACYSHMLLQNNVVHDMGRRSISIYNYGSGFTTTDIIVEGNTLYNGFHTTGIDISCGSGGAGSADFDGIIIRNNLVYDDANSFNYGSEDLNIESYYTDGVNIHNVLIYDNIIKNVQNSGIHIYGVKGADIFNNTFYGHNVNASGNTAHIKIQNECTDVVIKNNIFYTPLNVESSSRGNAIYTSTSQTTASITADYNIYYRIDPTYRIIELKGGATVYKMNQIANIRSGLGWETHGQTVSPSFESITNLHVLGGSPAIGAGIVIPEVITDFENIAYTNPPNIGCYATPTATANPTYVGSVIENATPALLEVSFNKTLTNIVPATSAFSVMVNSVTRIINSISITGAKVQLTLSSPVVYGDVVTVAYTKPITNPIQTSLGEQADSFTAKSVTNNISAPAPVYVSAIIQNATPTLLEVTYNLSLANIIPASTSFSVMVNSVNRAVNAVTISGTIVRLTLASAVAYGDIVTVTYTKPAANPLQTSSGGQAASISNKAVTNNVNPAIPIYVSSVIENANPTILSMTYSLNLANITPASAAFSILVNSASVTINSVVISGTKVQLTISSAILYGDVVTVSYTKPGSNPLQTASGGQVASFSAKPVTNNVGSASPVYISSTVENANPALVEMTYQLNLANIIPSTTAFTVTVNSASRSVSSVTINGTKVRLTLASPVAYSDVITVAYTKPAVNPLQTSTGGQAATLSATAVTNNVSPTNPVYISSVIENTSTYVVSITFSYPLLNIIPTYTAFSVMVNSIPRTITSVSISGTLVILTLANSVASGDVVTVAYTKPGINPLQTSSGGQVDTFAAKSVNNNIGVTNSPPVIVTVYPDLCTSGFVYGIDASASYDINSDILSFSWTGSPEISISSISTSSIQFLAPIVSISKTFKITLNLSDGKSTQTEEILITVLPYKHELSLSALTHITSSSYSGTNYPEKVNDGNLNSFWSESGDNQWVIGKMKDPFRIDHLKLSFPKDGMGPSFFDILASLDSLVWDPIVTNATSCGFSSNHQVFQSAGSELKAYSYIKFVGHGNSLNSLNKLSELQVYGGAVYPNSDKLEVGMTIYPNPTSDLINIFFTNSSQESQLIRIVNFSGKLEYEATLETGVTYLQLPVTLSSGFYIIQLLSDGKLQAASKLIVQ